MMPSTAKPLCVACSDAPASITFAWPAVHSSIERLDGAVHVWAARLDVPADVGARLEATLSLDERRHAWRYKTDLLRRRYATGRGVLRTLLGAYLGVPPSCVQFSYEEHRKPALSPIHRGGPQFNLTHSGGLALYAFARDRRVGVDVEAIKAFSDMTTIATHFFSAVERRALSRAAPDQLAPTFFSIWTRKEAYLKAEGMGLLAPLDSFDVSADPGAPAKLQRVDGDPGAPARWSLTHLEPAVGFLGALAVEGPSADVLCRQWLPDPTPLLEVGA